MSELPSVPSPARPVVRRRALRYLRLLSLLAGVLALVHPPLLLRRVAHRLPDIAEPFVMLGGMLLRACGFLIVFTLVLYLSFIYPLMHTPKPRTSTPQPGGSGAGNKGRSSQPASRAMR